MRPIIQRATAADVEKILELLTRLYLELGEEKESVGFLSGALIEEIMLSGQTEIFLVKDALQTMGIFTLTESQAIYAGGKFGVLDEMYIAPDYRSQKVGQALIEFLVETAKSRKWKRVDVTAPTEAKWQRTEQFYERHGFIFTGKKYKLHF